ncbi:conserved Plasmodium protein, unknown function [Plasmodium malariae]|uniref:Uncharacterized protein n=1 Tax=Plasmodium malariae TaxID=5858 RepID=A0A1C3KCR1_PLAMA|nr:conserved Plasmodium protein, unknown function [Plasmodium malariae]
MHTIQEKLCKIKKLLELQRFQKDESRENLIKLLRELYLIYMFYDTEDTNSENHTNNGEKILMINLIKLIEKKTAKLFSCYPNIWKGHNSSFFFYILSTQYEDRNLNTNFFAVLKYSENVYTNIYISSLLFSSDHFLIKIKTLKFIFYKYVLYNGNKNVPTKFDNNEKKEEKEDILNKKANFANFLTGENDYINMSEQMSCFFFSVIAHLIKQDYITLLKKRKKENDEVWLKRTKKQMEKGKGKTKTNYINKMIHYVVSKNIFDSHFNHLEGTIFSENIKLNEKNNTSKNNSSDDEEYDKKNKKLRTIKKENMYYNTEKDTILCCEIRNYYDENFLKSIFLYVKNLCEEYEKLLTQESYETKINKNYISCFLTQCVTILFNICCLNSDLINNSYDLIRNIKRKLPNYMNTSIVVSIAEFILFFSSEEQFVNVSNYLFIFISKEYKNYLTAITFFDFIRKNINILNKRKFFFKKYCFVILKIYFYHYRIFNNDLIYFLPHLIYENNYKDVFSFLLHAPLLLDNENVERAVGANLFKKTNKILQLHNGFKEPCEEGKEKVLVLELDNLQFIREAKCKRKVMDIVQNMHKYFKIYFEAILSSEQEWIIEITKVILHKLRCSYILEMLNRESIKEILKSLNDIINSNSRILLILKNEFINLLRNESNYYFLINTKVLEMLAQNIKHMNINYVKIEDYYITLNSLFSNENFNQLKFWVSLIHAFTNIALYCHDLSNNILNTYKNFISQNNVTLIIKHAVIENINIIKNVAYAKNVS